MNGPNTSTRASLLPRNPHHLHPRGERRGFHAQQSCCAAIAADFPIRGFQCAEDIAHSKVFISACKVRAPTLEAVAEEQAGNLTVVKVDIDENPELATRFNIQSIPTLIVFEGGEAKKTLKGLLPKRALLDELAPFLAKAVAVVS